MGIRALKGLVAFICHFRSFLDKIPLWRERALGYGSRTWLEADPREMEMPTPPRITSAAPHMGMGKVRIPDPGQPQQHHFGDIWQQCGVFAWRWWKKKQGWVGSPSLLPPHRDGADPRGGLGMDSPSCRTHGGWHSYTWAHFILWMHSHCFCSTAKVLLIPNHSPSLHFKFFTAPSFPTPQPLCCFHFGVLALLGVCFLGRSQRTIRSDSLFFFLPRSI